MQRFLLFGLLLLGIIFVGCRKEEKKSDEKEIVSFSIPNRDNHVYIEGSKISVYVYRNVDVTKLVPMVVVSKRARVYPYSGATVDFTNPVTYTVVAEDGSIATYEVSVHNTLSSRSDILVFRLVGAEQIFEREGDSLLIYVPYETDITNIETYIVVSDSVSISPASGKFMDFTHPQTYTTTSSDGTTRNYWVKIKKSPWRNILKNGEAPFAPRDQHELLVFKDKLWMLAGWIGGGTHANEVWNTEDGKNWNLVNGNTNWGTRTVSSIIAFKGKLWIMGGYSNTGGYYDDIGIYSSVDGITWVKHVNVPPWGTRFEPTLVEFKGKLWLMGGIKDHWSFPAGFNDIWSSGDGINWTREVEYAPWTERGTIHGRVVLNDAMYLIGGGILGDPDDRGLGPLVTYNDVWKSTDGVNWKRILRNAPWEARVYHTVVAYNGVMYVISGTTLKESNTNDVWKSTDGINWEQVKYSFWSPRHATSVVGWKGKLWMVGGWWVNDVWSMDL